MALVTFSRTDVEKLLGKKLTDRDYSERVTMIGAPLERITETEVDFEIFPNRPDLLSAEGFARALQGFLGIKKGLVKYDVRKSDYKVFIEKTVLGKRGCAAFVVVKNLRFSDEGIAQFMQLQEKLAATIGRKRKKCSIGTYDLEQIKFPVKLTTKDNSYTFRPLGFEKPLSIREILQRHPKGIEYAHLLKDEKLYPLYMDAQNRTMSLLPITNAEFAKVEPESKNILVEVTGTEWRSVFEMLNIVACALAERGAELYEVKTIYPSKKIVLAPNLKPHKIEFNPEYANKLLDLDLKQNEIRTLLERMRFGISGKAEVITNAKINQPLFVWVPAYRTDVMHPIDLVEEIAIAHGYEKFEPRIPKLPTIGKPLEKIEMLNRVRELMLGLGFQEVVNFVLSNKQKEFENCRRKENSVVEIQNPKTADYTIARTSLIPSLLGTLSQNASTEMPLKVFEVGLAVNPDVEEETGASEVYKLCCVVMHSSASYSEMKSYAENILQNLGKKFELQQSKDSVFIEGRAVDIFVKGEKIGVFGEVHPEVLINFGIGYPVVIFEIKV